MKTKKNRHLRWVNGLVYIFFLLVFLNCSKDSSSPEQDPITNDPNPGSTNGNLLPILRVNTNGAAIVDEPKVNATLTITDNDIVDFDGDIAIEFRGASSQFFFPKKQFGFETRDANNLDINVSLLGMPPEEDWILNGPYSDKSLVRNLLAYDLSRAIGRYASRAKFVQLYVNGTDLGIYLLMEKLKRNIGRIAIEKLKIDENLGEDITGGYILKIDKVSASDPGGGSYNPANSFPSPYLAPFGSFNQPINFLYEYPDADQITDAQKTYIANYVGDFENALASANFTDPVTGYAAYIDVDSFIDFFLLNEIANNVDGYRLSTFLNKDKNGKLKMGPIWDYNLAFGNANYCNGGDTNVWAYQFNERCPDDMWLIPFWWEKLLQDPVFVVRLKERWGSLRGNAFSDSAVLAQIDAYTKVLDDADIINQNFRIWPVLGEFVWPNNFVGNTYGEEVSYLKSWLEDRLTWLDTEIEKL